MTTRPGTEAEQRTLRTVRALVILDPAGATGRSPEKEFNELLLVYEQDYDLKLDARRADVFDPAEADRAEMILFDWGGMSLGNDLLGHQVRALLPWAEDHPSALVIIRSMLSWQYLQDEIEEEQLPALPNVIYDDGHMQVPAWWLATGTGGRATAR